MNENTKKNIIDVVYKYGDIIIVDMMNQVCKFLWVNNGLTVNVNGMVIPTGHIYGFMKYITFLRSKFPNCSIILAVDGYDEKRREINESYKGDREASDINIRSALKDIITLCGVYDGIYTVYDKRYEADDAMYSVSKKIESLCEKNGVDKNIYLMTNDKDLLQCAGGRITVFRKFGKGENWFEEADRVNTYDDIQRFFPGVSAKNLAVFRAITGDYSDNLKGYHGFYKKNAAYIAENTTPCEVCLIENEGFDPKYSKALETINKDFRTFKMNYGVMRLKDFDFEIDSVNHNVYKAVELSMRYKLKSFQSDAIKKSPYRSDIIDVMRKLGCM